MAKVKEERKKLSLDQYLNQAKKALGKNTLGGVDDVHVPIARISTGSNELDNDLNGGWHRGKIHEIWGLEASGKSLLTLIAIANAQAQGLKVAFIDAEMTYDPIFAAGFGVDNDDLILMKPDYGEQALEVVDELARTGEVGLIVIDSVSALTPKAEMDAGMEANHVGLQARMMGQALRKLTPIAAKSNTAIIFINQIREKVGVMYGDPRTTSGGNSLKYYASIRAEVRLVKTEDSPRFENGKQVGHRMAVQVKKSKVGSKVEEAVEFDINYFGGGIDNESAAFNTAIKAGIITSEKGHYFVNGEKFAYGKPKAIEYFLANREEFVLPEEE